MEFTKPHIYGNTEQTLYVIPVQSLDIKIYLDINA